MTKCVDDVERRLGDVADDIAYRRCWPVRRLPQQLASDLGARHHRHLPIMTASALRALPNGAGVACRNEARRARWRADHTSGSRSRK